MKIRKVKLSVGDVLIVADSHNQTVYRLMLTNQEEFPQDLGLVLHSCNSDVRYSYRSSDIQKIDDLIQNSADSRRSPANAADLADTSVELTETVETVDSDLIEVSAGQGSNLFKLSDFKTGLYAHWQRCVDNTSLPNLRWSVFDMYLSLSYPGFSRGLMFTNKYQGAPSRYLRG